MAFDKFPTPSLFGAMRESVDGSLLMIWSPRTIKCSERYGDHVFVDLSWVVFEDYMIDRDEDGSILDDDDGDARVKDEWVALIEKYPNNFILGSDIVADFRKYRAEIRKYNALLKQLTPDTRTKVANGNFVRIMPQNGVTLTHDYVYPEKRFTRYDGPLPEPPVDYEEHLEKPRSETPE